MTEDEFRAKLGQSLGTPVPPPVVAAPPAFTPPAPVQYTPPAPRPVAAQTGGYQKGNGFKKGFASSTKVPLTVRQSKKDGQFYLSGYVSFKVDIDQQAVEYMKQSGEGLGEIKAGEVTFWPPYNKNANAE